MSAHSSEDRNELAFRDTGIRYLNVAENTFGPHYQPLSRAAGADAMQQSVTQIGWRLYRELTEKRAPAMYDKVHALVVPPSVLRPRTEARLTAA